MEYLYRFELYSSKELQVVNTLPDTLTQTKHILELCCNSFDLIGLSVVYSCLVLISSYLKIPDKNKVSLDLVTKTPANLAGNFSYHSMGLFCLYKRI